jgi:hypothetical protein
MGPRGSAEVAKRTPPMAVESTPAQDMFPAGERNARISNLETEILA